MYVKNSVKADQQYLYREKNTENSFIHKIFSFFPTNSHTTIDPKKLFKSIRKNPLQESAQKKVLFLLENHLLNSEGKKKFLKKLVTKNALFSFTECLNKNYFNQEELSFVFQYILQQEKGVKLHPLKEVLNQVNLFSIIEKTIAQGNINVSRLKELIELVDEKLRRPLVEQTILFLTKKGAFNQACLIQELIQNLPRIKRNVLLDTFEKIRYFLRYAKWTVCDYVEERFEQLTSLFKESTGQSIIEGQIIFNKKYLPYIAKVRKKNKTTALTEKIAHSILSQRISKSIANEKKYVEFLVESELDEALSYYKHRLSMTSPKIAVNGIMTNLSEIIERFSIEYLNIGPKDIPILIEKNTKTRWIYGKDGLIKHTNSLIPIRKVAPSQKNSISFICTNHGNTITPQGIQRLLSSHSWIELEDQLGHVYSIGRCGNGTTVCPDIMAYKKYPKIAVSFFLEQEKFDELFTILENTLCTEEPFNLLSDNCSSFSSLIAKKLFSEVDARSELSKHNTLENRIKLFAVSEQLAESMLTKKDALILFQKEHPNPTLFSLLEFLSKEKPYFAQEELVHIFSYLQKFSIVSLESNNQLKEIIETIVRDTSTKKSLTNKFFALFSDIYTAVQKEEVAHPYTLFLHLEKQKGAKVTYIR